MAVTRIVVARTGENTMRHVWAYGAWTAWLVVPFGGIFSVSYASGAGINAVIIIGLMVGLTGVIAMHWALSALVYRLLKPGDEIELAEEVERDKVAAAKSAAFKAGRS